MADEENEAGAEIEESGGGLTKKLMMGGAGLILIVAGIFAGPSVMNMISPPETEEQAESEEEEPSKKPELFTSLHPPLVVNVKDAAGDAHFMQITMEVMARDQDVINSVREYTPVIRNNLILLFGTAQYESVTTRDGKEKLLADGLAEIQDILLQRIGDEGVEALYFTGLIIQ